MTDEFTCDRCKRSVFEDDWICPTCDGCETCCAGCDEEHDDA
jgi:hypothetical protein